MNEKEIEKAVDSCINNRNTAYHEKIDKLSEYSDILAEYSKIDFINDETLQMQKEAAAKDAIIKEYVAETAAKILKDGLPQNFDSKKR